MLIVYFLKSELMISYNSLALHLGRVLYTVYNVLLSKTLSNIEIVEIPGVSMIFVHTFSLPLSSVPCC